MSEVSTVKSRASVMMYNNEKKAWEPAEGVRGMSHVQVYHHEGNNTFRIVGRSMTDHQVVVINCSIIRNMKYNAATPTFHQWRDQRQVYGLNFHSKDDAAQFKDAVDEALDTLNAASQPQRSHTQQYVPQNTPKNWQNRYPSQNDAAEEAQREPEKPKTVSSSISITPSAPAAPTPPAAPPGPPQPPAAPPTPTPPAAPPAPAAPAAPPAPPMAGGGVPAPPPPPPPPPSGGSAGGGGGGSLAQQIAAAKLKKAQEQPKPEPKQSRGGGSGGDMMAEMQRKLAARKAKEGGDEPAPARNHMPAVESRSEPRADRTPSGTICDGV
ncbi:Hypothetical predicted protein [Paramuricea clavata]|uniref:Uncharacterized protein n=1 Tax=Paramuricea clavata TaxID=317549 RepID=A0A7D9KYK9_PARCT|nr:Hypothetical predicted protein [Paramuricea clavata]